MPRLKPIRLLVVDDHPVVRTGLRMVEQIASDIRIVGEAASAAEALARIQELAPHVVLLDLRLPDTDGLEVCRRSKKLLPDTRVLCLTSHADARLVLGAMEAGADGYLLKHNDAHRIADAVRGVMTGQAVFDPALEALPEDSHGGARTANPLAVLSPGELRVLAEVAKGLTDKEVSSALNLSVKTVRNTLDRIFAKLGVHTRTQAAMVYARHWPVSFDEPDR